MNALNCIPKSWLKLCEPLPGWPMSDQYRYLRAVHFIVRSRMINRRIAHAMRMQKAQEER